MPYLIIRNAEDIVAVVEGVPDYVDVRMLAESLVPAFTSAYRVQHKPNYSDIQLYDVAKSAKFKVAIENNGQLVSVSIDGRVRRYTEADFRKLVATLTEVVKKLDELHTGDF
jgi:hypothetical protein